MAQQLPEELIIEILLWLPVKSLKRFRCLSKSLCEVIDSPDFINLHLNRSSQNFNLRSKMIFTDRSMEKFHVCDVNDDLEEDILPLVVQQVSTLWRGGEVCGNCNGLLLLCQTLRYPFRLALWNPSTGQYRDLPYCPCEEVTGNEYFCIINGSGLVYDDSTDDYKAIITIYHIEVEVEVQVWIYSLKSNIWRRTQNFPYYLDVAVFHNVIGCFTDGSLHWICTFRNDNQSVDRRKEIVAFDVSKEIFSLVSKPVICSINSLDSLSLKLHILEGCLCISYYCYSKPVRVDLFIRKKDGADQLSWAKLFSVTEPVSFNIRSFRFLRVLRYSRRGDKVLLDLGGITSMVSYDLIEKSFRMVKIDIDKDPDWRYPIVFLESLVSIGGGA